ncbi:MAG: retention module-containing protein, partial [Pseudomonadota bacterium]
MAESGVFVGKVSLVQGQVSAKGLDGATRLLKVGDPVYEGDVIQTSEAGRIELALNDGTAYFLRNREAVTLDDMVLGGRILDAKEAALLPQRAGELDDISRAIAEGNSLDRLLEETAAGRAGIVGNLDDSHSFVQLLRIVEAIDPLGYAFGIRDGGRLGDISGEDVLGEEENAERGLGSEPIGEALETTVVTLTASAASVTEGGSIIYTATVNNAVTGSPLVITLDNGKTIT